MKGQLLKTCQPASRQFRRLHTSQIRCLIGLKLGENRQEQLKTLEPGQRVDYLKVRDNANLAAELGAELILRKIFDRETYYE